MPGSRPRIDARRASGSAMVCTITMSSAGGVVRLTPLMWEAEYLILKAVKPSPPFIGAFQLMITSSQLLTSIGSSMNGWPGEAARGTPRRLRQDYGGRTALQWEEERTAVRRLLLHGRELSPTRLAVRHAVRARHRLELELIAHPGQLRRPAEAQKVRLAQPGLGAGQAVGKAGASQQVRRAHLAELVQPAAVLRRIEAALVSRAEAAVGHFRGQAAVAVALGGVRPLAELGGSIEPWLAAARHAVARARPLRAEHGWP